MVKSEKKGSAQGTPAGSSKVPQDEPQASMKSKSDAEAKDEPRHKRKRDSGIDSFSQPSPSLSRKQKVAQALKRNISSLTKAAQLASSQLPPTKRPKTVEPTIPTGPITGSQLFEHLESCAMGGETAKERSNALLSSQLHTSERTQLPKGPKLKAKCQAEGPKSVSGKPISTLLSKQSKGVLKRLSSQEPAQPTSSVMPSSTIKKGVDFVYRHSPTKKVSKSKVSESTSKSPTKTSLHSGSAQAANDSPRSQGVSQASNSAQYQEVPSTTSIDEPFMADVDLSTIPLSINQEEVKAPTNVALEMVATTQDIVSAADKSANDTLPLGNEGNEASLGVQDSSMALSIEKETSQRVHDSTGISQPEDETPQLSQPIGNDPKGTSHTGGEPSHQTEPTNVGKVLVPSGGFSYKEGLHALLAACFPTSTIIGDLPDPNESKVIESTNDQNLGDFSVSPSSMDVCGEGFSDQIDQSEGQSASTSHQADQQVRSPQLDREVTSSHDPHTEPQAPYASSPIPTPNRSPKADNIDPRGLNEQGPSPTHQPPQPTSSINDVVAQLTEIKASVSSEFSQLNKRLDDTNNELTEMVKHEILTLETRLKTKLDYCIHFWFKDMQVHEDAL